MRRIAFDQFGEPSRVLRIEEVADPIPGPGEVVVRMQCRTINPADLLTVRGIYGTRPKLPAVPGYEGVGTVEVLGEGVDGIAVGARVVPLGNNGTWQDRCVARASSLIPVPKAIDDESAAQLIINPLTALAMVEDVHRVEPGEWLLQTAAGSTLGRLMLQLARRTGFRTINLVRREAQVEEIRALGGDVVATPDAPDLVARIRDATGEKGVVKAIDAVGGDTGAVALSALGPGGSLLVYGMLSGRPIPLDASLLVFRGISVRGFWLTQWFRRTPAERRQALIERLIGLVQDRSLVPPVAAVFPLADIQAAVAEAERPGRAGKVLLAA